MQSVLISQKEDRIETFEQLFKRDDIIILIDGDSNNYRILQKVYLK
jgi:5S rRNA maturation endonuclease (ribonuclease M5)